ncbi:AP-1 complex subunit sigma-3 isoform X2 [Lates calcarifer]|uniref:AP complex subunit sigma n=1 Tax=Lates calcarifer TaxID=8187 RepID=A0AAJ8B6D2_LATCA|nr:AP-1 complex subunit sigma-3 isoform X2 [Lates calcarifer]
MMRFLLLFSRQGKLRLQKWFTPMSDREKKKIIRDMTTMVLARQPRSCNFLHWKDLKIIYKRYASLYFCLAIESQENELLALEVIHRYVELLDKYFGNVFHHFPPFPFIQYTCVCELDIIFNFEKAYFILDEFLMGGEIQETSKQVVNRCIESSDMLQETMEEYMSKPAF